MSSSEAHDGQVAGPSSPPQRRLEPADQTAASPLASAPHDAGEDAGFRLDQALPPSEYGHVVFTPSNPPPRPMTPRQREKSALRGNLAADGPSTATFGHDSPLSSTDSPRASEAGNAQDLSASGTLPRLTFQSGNDVRGTLSISAGAPIPRSLALGVTISHTAKPHPKVIPNQEPLSRYAIQLAQSRRLGRRTQSERLPSGGFEDLSASTHSLPDRRGSISQSPASTATAATTAPTSPSQKPSPKAPAWAAPRSWAELALRSSRSSSVGTGPVAVATGSTTTEGTATGATTPAIGASVVLDSPQGAATVNGSQAGSAGASPGAAALAPALALQNAGKNVAVAHVPQPPQKHGLEAALSEAHLQFTAPLTLPRGLVNTGNMCFANSILQTLVFCAPFYNLLATVGRELPHDFANRTPLIDATIQFVREFPLAADSAALSPYELQSAVEPFTPEYVYEAMRLKKRFDAMRRGHQEDAEEFLGFFLDSLHEELLYAIQRANAKVAATGMLNKLAAAEKPANGFSEEQLAHMSIKGGDDAASEISEREVVRPVSPSEEGWMEVGQKGKTSFTRTTSTSDSPITHIFGGKLRSVLRTPGAKDSVTLEPYQPLQLDIQPQRVHTIEDALRNLTEPEVIRGVYSPSRDAIVDATKQVFIESLPPVLVLHLKRFVYDEIGGVQKYSKEIGYDTILDVAPEVISPTRRADTVTKYRLFGVVYHHGRYATGGHYTVDVLRQDSEEWIHIDDTHVSPVSIDQVRRVRQRDSDDFVQRGPSSASGHEGLAYLLFYQREDLAARSKSAAAGTEAKAHRPAPRLNGHAYGSARSQSPAQGGFKQVGKSQRKASAPPTAPGSPVASQSPANELAAAAAAPPAVPGARPRPPGAAPPKKSKAKAQ